MTIIEMGMAAGLCDKDGFDEDGICIVNHLNRFAKLVAKQERDACVQVCRRLSNTMMQRRTEAPGFGLSAMALSVCGDHIEFRDAI